MSEHEQLSFSTGSETNDEPVVCLGLTFNNDDERREYFREKLRKKLPELKQIEGFPIGEDEDIIALSDPPYYTACPNPWINQLINVDREHIENHNKKVVNHPYVHDVAEGKNDPFYMLHSYHTKVPYKALMHYLLHYTNPGDVIYDGFCGSGMTGIAALACGSTKEIESIGYKIIDNEIYDENNQLIGKKGERRAILSDLSPLATHLTSNINLMYKDKIGFFNFFTTLLEEVKSEYGWMYETQVNGSNCEVNYGVWSESFLCPNCLKEIDFWDSSIDRDNNQVMKFFNCNSCHTKLEKKDLLKNHSKKFVPEANQIKTTSKYNLKFYNVIYNGKRYEKLVDQDDLLTLERIYHLKESIRVPTKPIPPGDEVNRLKSNNVEFTHQLISDRNNIILNAIKEKIEGTNYFQQSMFIITAALTNLTRMYRWRSNGKGGVISGTYYLPSTAQENNPFKQLHRKLNEYMKINKFSNSRNIISTNSATKIELEDNSVDYIFTDPPFGSNLMYSELNLVWETWLGTSTNNNLEAIINKTQQKDISAYSNLMTKSFKEYYRILKENSWITIEFSNSQSKIWNAIQESIQKAGFMIVNVAALDKKQGSFKALTSTVAVKQDLVISAFKPSDKVIKDIKRQNGSEQSAWTFVRYYLENLPIESNGNTFILERTPRILFDRMVAYHVQNGLDIPISSAEFQQGVLNRFPTRDGMAFLESQVLQYDKNRIKQGNTFQGSLFISDENSAIEWLRQQLIAKPQSRQDLHTQFMKEIQHISKHEKLPELDDLLVQNFLRYDNELEVPSQIVSYFRKNYPDLRGLEPTDEKIKQKAINRWYVPDPNKQADLEKLREKSLLREFNLYVDEMTKSKKKLKEFRTEAIRAGFKKAWSEKDYQTIVDVGNRLPETVIQEDDKLLMYFDNAQIKLGL